MYITSLTKVEVFRLEGTKIVAVRGFSLLHRSPKQGGFACLAFTISDETEVQSRMIMGNKVQENSRCLLQRLSQNSIAKTSN
jgi:hypothetical protein